MSEVNVKPEGEDRAPPPPQPAAPSAFVNTTLGDIRVARQKSRLDDGKEAESELKAIVKKIRRVDESALAEVGIRDGDEWKRLLAVGLQNLAAVQRNNGKLQKAVKNAEEANALETDTGMPSPATMLGLVGLYTAVGEYEWAIDMADSAINVMATRSAIPPSLWAAVYHNKAVASLHMLLRYGEGSPQKVYQLLEVAKGHALQVTIQAEVQATLDSIQNSQQQILQAFGPQRTVSEKNNASQRRQPKRPETDAKSSSGNSAAKPKPGALLLPSISKHGVQAAMRNHAQTHKRYSFGEPVGTTNVARVPPRRTSNKASPSAKKKSSSAKQQPVQHIPRPPSKERDEGPKRPRHDSERDEDAEPSRRSSRSASAVSSRRSSVRSDEGYGSDSFEGDVSHEKSTSAAADQTRSRSPSAARSVEDSAADNDDKIVDSNEAPAEETADEAPAEEAPEGNSTQEESSAEAAEVSAPPAASSSRSPSPPSDRKEADAAPVTADAADAHDDAEEQAPEQTNADAPDQSDHVSQDPSQEGDPTEAGDANAVAKEADDDDDDDDPYGDEDFE